MNKYIECDISVHKCYACLTIFREYILLGNINASKFFCEIDIKNIYIFTKQYKISVSVLIF